MRSFLIVTKVNYYGGSRQIATQVNRYVDTKNLTKELLEEKVAQWSREAMSEAEGMRVGLFSLTKAKAYVSITNIIELDVA